MVKQAYWSSHFVTPIIIPIFSIISVVPHLSYVIFILVVGVDVLVLIGCTYQGCNTCIFLKLIDILVLVALSCCHDYIFNWQLIALFLHLMFILEFRFFIDVFFSFHISYKYNKMNENPARYKLSWSSQLTIDP